MTATANAWIVPADLPGGLTPCGGSRAVVANVALLNVDLSSPP